MNSLETSLTVNFLVGTVANTTAIHARIALLNDKNVPIAISKQFVFSYPDEKLD